MNGDYFTTAAGAIVGGHTCERRLGTGRFASVWLARANTAALAAGGGTGDSVAVKLFRSDGHSVESWSDEVGAMKTIADSDFTTHIIACGVHMIETPTSAIIHPWIAMRVEAISVHQLLQWYLRTYDTACPHGVVRAVVGDILRGIRDLNAHGYCHGDLKLHNLMVDRSADEILRTDALRVRIADFGHACKIGDKHGPGGTKEYRAPEIEAEHDEWDISCDVWSVGMIAFELITSNRLVSTSDPSYAIAYVDPDAGTDTCDCDVPGCGCEGDGADGSDSASDASGASGSSTDMSADAGANDEDACDSADELTSEANSADDSSEDPEVVDRERIIILRIYERVIGHAPAEVRAMFPTLYAMGKLVGMEYPVDSVDLARLFTERYGVPNPHELADFIGACCRYLPATRATPDALLSMPWMLVDA